MKRGFLIDRTASKPSQELQQQEFRPIEDERSEQNILLEQRRVGWDRLVSKLNVPKEDLISNVEKEKEEEVGNHPIVSKMSYVDWMSPSQKRSRPPEERMEADEENIPEETEATTEDEKDENVLKGVPFFPTSSFGTPKLALNSLYGKQMGIMLPNNAYFHWDDKGPPHLLKHNCVFVCPITYERFPAGCYGNPNMYTIINGIVWYKQKKLAEQGASARRYDCYVYRQNLEENPMAIPKCNFGSEKPYKEKEGPVVLVPEEIEDKILAAVEQWTIEKEERAENERLKKLALEEEAVYQDHLDQENQAYRDARVN